MPPQTAVELLRDGLTPTDCALLGAAVGGVLGTEFLDIGPVEAFEGRRWTEGAARVRPARGDAPGVSR